MSTIPQNSDDYAVQTLNLSKNVGDFHILRSVSMDVKKGTICGIIGRSGAGKTTLLRCLNGLDKPSSGEIKLLGQSTTTLNHKERRQLQRKIGTVFQHFHLLQRRTVFDNVAFPLELQKIPKSVIKEKVEGMLKRVGLLEKSNAYPHTLSGGQCQRVAIARALVTDATLLLCDEFTSALDPETTMDILELLASLNKDLNLTVVLITHDMHVVRELCDTVVVLEQGECVETGDITSILLSPKHTMTQSLVRTLFSHELPKSYAQRIRNTPSMSCHAVVQLLFTHKVAREPIIAHLVEKCHLPVNIIAGHLDHVRHTAFGHLTITFPYSKENQRVIESFLEENNVKTQWLGYLDA